jgi:hypothetical protein
VDDADGYLDGEGKFIVGVQKFVYSFHINLTILTRHARTVECRKQMLGTSHLDTVNNLK